MNAWRVAAFTTSGVYTLRSRYRWKRTAMKRAADCRRHLVELGYEAKVWVHRER